MKHQTKILLVVFGIIVMAVVIFIFGIAVGAVSSEGEQEAVQVQECPEPRVIEREVEKIVYRDNPETQNDLELYRSAAELLAEGYTTSFPLAEAYMTYFGESMHQDWYDLYDLALELL